MTIGHLLLLILVDLSVQEGGIHAQAALEPESKTALRAVVTPSPEPVSNIALSSAEDVVAVGLTWFATHHPFIAASVAVVILIAAVLAARALLRAIHRPLRRLFGMPPEKGPVASKPSVE